MRSPFDKRVVMTAPNPAPILRRMFVSPEMATNWLSNNGSNRPLRKSHLASIALAMNADQFKLTHQPIAIDARGMLLDGQHRLRAIVLTGKTVELFVCFGADRSTFDVLDTGLVRTIAERLGTNIYNTTVATTLLRVAGSETNTTAKRQAFEVRDVLTAFGPELSECERLNGWTRRTRSASSPMRAAILLMIRRESDGRKQYLLHALEKFMQSELTELPSPFLTLYKQMQEPPYAAARKSGPYRQIDSFLRTWVAASSDQDDTKRILIKNPEHLLSKEVRPLFCAALALGR